MLYMRDDLKEGAGLDPGSTDWKGMIETRTTASHDRSNGLARVRLGVLTPSSNTVLEPLTQAMLASLGPAVSAHFQRFRVTRIGRDAASLGQFKLGPMIAAARLLADARVQVIAWSGTSGAWLGIERDRDLVAEIASATGARATTAVLALEEALVTLRAHRLGLVTPYVSEIQRRIVAEYAARGIEVVAERHFEDPGNFNFAEHSEAEIAEAVREVAAARPEAIAILCTNLRGAGVAAALEVELGIPVFDSVSASVWKSLVLAGIQPDRIAGWGRLFALSSASSSSE
ncbi:MAG: maleate cis-trans isomerase family protein [Acetobacteraceae bacterium]